MKIHRTGETGHDQGAKLGEFSREMRSFVLGYSPEKEIKHRER